MPSRLEELQADAQAHINRRIKLEGDAQYLQNISLRIQIVGQARELMHRWGQLTPSQSRFIALGDLVGVEDDSGI